MAPSIEHSVSHSIPVALSSPARAVSNYLTSMSSRKTPDSPTHTPSTPERNLVRSLSSSSHSYLASPSPITAAHPRPTYISTPISPPKRKYDDLLGQPPATDMERCLQDALRSAIESGTHHKMLALNAQSIAALSDSYVSRVHGQLQAFEERRKKPKKRQRLNGDGFGKHLTGDAFMAAVDALEAETLAEEQAKLERTEVTRIYRERMDTYKEDAAKIRGENEKIKQRFQKKLDNWKGKREAARSNGFGFTDAQPKRPPMKKLPVKPVKKLILAELETAVGGSHGHDDEFDSSSSDDSEYESDSS
ncbi:hypothetical protein CYLTODRAFT_427815 [Cylindrobasidium torrendii FP15055 ss-10]|uniref:Uncharacterized protein n=1 Tax=Cylindrobasidium torrendii FP15055 ss-10 TaxID=1314674 RepID=A0A0D7AQV4_9AGAR|nr:hypothetical protein CYLTODRAFT_427815 [Cylindrobasidium torrendii FP15055 ss-10]